MSYKTIFERLIAFDTITYDLAKTVFSKSCCATY